MTGFNGTVEITREAEIAYARIVLIEATEIIVRIFGSAPEHVFPITGPDSRFGRPGYCACGDRIGTVEMAEQLLPKLLEPKTPREERTHDADVICGLAKQSRLQLVDGKRIKIALTVLGGLGRGITARTIIEGLDKDSPVRDYLGEALLHIGPHAIPALGESANNAKKLVALRCRLILLEILGMVVRTNANMEGDVVFERVLPTGHEMAAHVATSAEQGSVQNSSMQLHLRELTRMRLNISMPNEPARMRSRARA